ncbi:MAG: hypothetical protein ACF8XB_09805 [Planctomycetota bacterium JB042]
MRDRLPLALLLVGAAFALSRCVGTPTHPSAAGNAPASSASDSSLIGFVTDQVRRELAAAAGVPVVTPIGLAVQANGTVTVFNANQQTGSVPVATLRATLQQHGLIP